MPWHRALIVFTTVTAFALLAIGNARAAAQVGETRHIPAGPSPALAFDQLKESYRRPPANPFPPENPFTLAKALLGRMLFHDTRLSGGGVLACATSTSAQWF
ncbi:MAG: hypothetical protein EXR07_08180 [Acetobacteraceae bacterium]|nr:hypothetical protein [Acetobacteraceae bacterium]